MGVSVCEGVWVCGYVGVKVCECEGVSKCVDVSAWVG